MLSLKKLLHKMHYEMHFIIVFVFIFCIIASMANAIPCDSCGNECASACGTKHFRTCCFNYLRKRTDPSNANKFITNKRLIDFMMLQGRAMYTQDELLSREQKLSRLKAAQRNNNRNSNRSNGSNSNNGTIIDIYYI